MTPVPPWCISDGRACKHWRLEKWGTCDAYPGAIPPEILTGKVGHLQPYPGDGGIVFEQMGQGGQRE